MIDRHSFEAAREAAILAQQRAARADCEHMRAHTARRTSNDAPLAPVDCIGPADVEWDMDGAELVGGPQPPLPPEALEDL